ncbi:Hypothetical protein D9617_4g001380 [Elsinoe fawcettii]|nr:Hypothetical protein D9617_4g001380 [Elsinoe fawcettii]
MSDTHAEDPVQPAEALTASMAPLPAQTDACTVFDFSGDIRVELIFRSLERYLLDSSGTSAALEALRDSKAISTFTDVLVDQVIAAIIGPPRISPRSLLFALDIRWVDIYKIESDDILVPHFDLDIAFEIDSDIDKNYPSSERWAVDVAALLTRDDERLDQSLC